MKYLKQTAWYGSAVAFAAIMAVALLLVSPAEKASATAVSSVTMTAPTQIAGFTETWTLTFTTDGGAGALINGNTITLEFPTSFTVLATPTIAIVSGFTSGGGNDCDGTAAAFASDTLTITLADTGNDCELASGATGVLTIAGITNSSAAGTMTGNVTPSATAGWEIATTADDNTGVFAGSVEIVSLTISASVTSIPGDGISQTQISLASSAAAANSGGGTITIAVDNGTFVGIPESDLGHVLVADPVIAGDGKSASGTVVDTYDGTTAATVTLQAPSTGAGSATVTARYVPAAGGAAVLLGIVTVTYTTPTALPGAAASGSKTTPSSALSVGSTDSTSVTVTFVDANDVAPLGGETVSISTTLGQLTGSPAGATCLNAICTGGTLTNSGLVTFTFTGGGVSGAGTITVTAGTIIVSIPVTVTGTGSDFTATTASTVTGATAGDTTSYITVTVLDANGNVVPGVTLAAADVDTTSTTNLTITADTNGPTGDSCEAETGSDGACDFLATTSSTSSLGDHSISITVSGNATVVVTATVRVVGAAATIVITAPDTITALGTTTITVSVTTAEGDPVSGGTTVTVAATGNGVIIPANGIITTTADTGDATFTLVASADAGDITLVAIVGALDPVQATVTIGDGTTPAADTPAAATAFTAPPAGGLTQGVAGTTDFQALIDAQTFTVESIWKLDVATQVFQTYIPGGLEIANTLTSLAASDIVTLKSQ